MLKNCFQFTQILSIYNELATCVVKRYAGHSKWANIRHTKGAKDVERGALFTRLGRLMRVAVQEGGSIDPKLNLKLEQVLEQARRANMPKATVQSIIKSAQGNKSLAKSYLLEIKGPGSAMILVDVFSENVNITKANVNTIMKKHSGKYADGGARHMFAQKGIILAERSGNDSEEKELEKATDNAIECGAEDVKLHEDGLEFHCAASSLKIVVTALEKLYTVTSASVEYIPLQGQELSDEEMVECGKLLAKIEAMPDVIRTYDNIV